MIPSLNFTQAVDPLSHDLIIYGFVDCLGETFRIESEIPAVNSRDHALIDAAGGLGEIMIASNDEQQIRQAIADQIGIRNKGHARFAVDLPLEFPDGDCCRVFVSRNDDGSWRVGDAGSSVMRASYEESIDVLSKGYKSRFQQIVSLRGLQEAKGEIIRASTRDIGEAVFAIAQASLEIVNLAATPAERKKKKPSPNVYPNSMVTGCSLRGAKTGVLMSELTVVDPPPRKAQQAGNKPASEDPFRSHKDDAMEEKPGMAIERTTLDEGAVILQFPGGELSKPSAEDLEYWFNGIIKKIKRKAGIQDIPKKNPPTE